MRIAKIDPHPKDLDRRQIILEGGKTLTLTTELVAQFYLYPGKELEPEDLEAIIHGEEARRVKRRAMQLLDYRAMSRRELIDKLVQKGESKEVAEDAAHWLEEMRLLDDANYAENVVRHYGAKGYGKLRIQQELYRRGIDKDLWETAFEAMPEDRGALDKFIQTKLKGERPDRKEEKRVADALYRRGYTWDEISEGFRRYRETLDE